VKPKRKALQRTTEGRRWLCRCVPGWCRRGPGESNIGRCGTGGQLAYKKNIRRYRFGEPRTNYLEVRGHPGARRRTRTGVGFKRRQCVLGPLCLPCCDGGKPHVRYPTPYLPPSPPLSLRHGYTGCDKPPQNPGRLHAPAVARRVWTARGASHDAAWCFSHVGRIQAGGGHYVRGCRRRPPMSLSEPHAPMILGLLAAAARSPSCSLHARGRR